MMSSRLTNTPSVFRVYINKVFGCLAKFVIVFIDDIPVHSKFEDGPAKDFKFVLQMLR